jgi:hypothetical protein
MVATESAPLVETTHAPAPSKSGNGPDGGMMVIEGHR